jgi:hypothetical protein
MTFSNRLASLLSILFSVFFITSIYAAPPPGKGNNKSGGKPKTLSTVRFKDWDESYVRRVLAAFAYGGLATDAQI